MNDMRTELDLLKTTDAEVWAEEFIKVKDAGAEIDKVLMVGWFANMWAATHDPLQSRIVELEKDKSMLVVALNSVANSTCCGDCEEAKKVAISALAKHGGKVEI